MPERALLPQIVAIAERAGAAILDIYSRPVAVTEKEDRSPLTEADLAAHKVIVAGLNALSALPVLSEEGAATCWSERNSWSRYWLIDPLDGTKEFIARNGEFTVNIALIEHGCPIIGVVHVPVQGRSYFAGRGLGAFRQEQQAEPAAIRVAPPCTDAAWRLVGSRSHRSAREQELAAHLGEVSLVEVGSSLKFCMVAEGRAELYPRFGLTSEWDTAAAQCIVEEAGGAVLHGETLEPLAYNRKDSLLNPHFIVCNERSPAWTGFFAAKDCQG